MGGFFVRTPPGAGPRRPGWVLIGCIGGAILHVLSVMATILLCTRDTSLIAMAESSLPEAGHAVSVLADGRECPTPAGVDAAVVDMELPPTNPHLLLDALGPADSFRPPVILTGALRQKLPRTLTLWGARLFLEKPLTPERLREGVAGVLPGQEGEGARIIAGLLVRYFHEKKTGVLVGRSGSEEKKVFLEEGYPRFTTSNQAADRFGEMLVKIGTITIPQYTEAIEEMKRSGKRLGEILIKKGLIRRESLLPLLLRQHEQVILSLFLWTKAEWDLREGETAGEGAVSVKTHPYRLVLDGLRQASPPAILARWLGSPDAVPVPAATLSETIEALGLEEKERTGIAVLDGTRSLREVMKASGMGALEVLSLLACLIFAGACTMRPQRQPTPTSG